MSAPAPATELRPAGGYPAGTAVDGAGAQPFSLTAATASLRLGLNVALLPWAARWFYLEAVGTAIRRNDRWTLDHVQPAEELARLLEIAQGSERIVEIGAQTGWTALALALSEETRSVISFRRPGASTGPSRFAHLVPASTRARVGSREQSIELVPRSVPGPADLVHVDVSAPCGDTYAALLGAGLIVRPGGLVVVRGGRQHEVLALVEELDLEASTVESLVVGRRPLEPDWAALAEPVLPPLQVPERRRAGPRRMRLLALGLTGSLVGAGVGLVLPLGGSLVNTDHATVGEGGAGGAANPGGPRGPLAVSQGAGVGSRAARTGSRAGTRARTGVPSGLHRTRGGQSRGGITAFSGTGRRRLGTIRVNEPLFLRWDADSGSFRIVSEAWGFRPPTRKGSVLLSPGTYRRFEVRGTGRWRLELSKP